MSTIHTIIFNSTIEIEAEIVATVTPGQPGTRYKRNGDPGDPPEPTEIEIESIRAHGPLVDINLRDLVDGNELYALLEQAHDEFLADQAQP